MYSGLLNQMKQTLDIFLDFLVIKNSWLRKTLKIACKFLMIKIHFDKFGYVSM